MQYIRKKVIKGIEYYYFEFPFRTTEGKRILFTRYLGKKLLSQEELKEKLKGYFEEIGKIAAQKMGKEILDYFPPNGIQRIESTRAWYHFINHELNENEFKLFKDLFVTLFVLNSNRAEGSRVTRGDIEKIINKRKKPRTKIDIEIVNSLDAINFAFSKDMKWNSASLRKIHMLLFKGIDDEIAGKYKAANNVVGAGGIASITTPKEKVKEEINMLISWLKGRMKKEYTPIISLKFHWKFEQIHPFQDGNGRVGRILLNALLMKSFFMPVIFFSENHRSYSNALAKAIERRESKLAKYFVEQLKKTGKMIDEYKKEGIIKGGSSSIGRWEIQKGRIRIY
ncbi:MAG: Fic family protein [Nanoarchaeota archaeon]|nr:Fic family protein [Nanoarchaeota archaeon]MBU1005217.1 Fic family protein [Nanoarchaeota archaeon]MBU1946888.1 Fic family protein [Nanoarchaeota archaeon]